MFFTIGYQRFTLQQLIQQLDENQIDLLVDVRTTPYSHNPQFCKDNLVKVLGKRYLWMGRALGGKTGHKPKGYDRALAILASESQKKNICVMCMEADPRKCHRGFWIAKDLNQKFEIAATHILDTATRWKMQSERRQTRLV